MAHMKVEALGYCGARCLTCFAYKKTVSEAAKALRRELRAEKTKVEVKVEVETGLTSALTLTSPL